MEDTEAIIAFVEQLISTQTRKSLSFIQKVILQDSLSEEKRTYSQIAKNNNYSEDYLKKVVAPSLWKLLSEVLGEKVNKSNCRALLKQRLESTDFLTIETPTETVNTISLENPEGQVPLISPWYVERPPLEVNCYQAIMEPSALIRIKAPRKMGKTSLMTRILAYGEKQNYHTVRLSLHRAETNIFTSVEKFMRWLCANVTRQVGLESKLDKYWDEDMGALVSSSIYFQGYILKEIEEPIILALDEINQLFDYPTIVQDFMALLRSWHEETKDIGLWRKLRLIIVHSTDVYISLPTNQSPFNVGFAIDLPPFNKSQVEDLANRHGLKLTSLELEQVIELIGGFPYLVRLAFYHCVENGIPLQNLLRDAVTNTSIFYKHLNYLMWKLEQNHELKEAFRQVLVGESRLDTEIFFKLYSLGLISLSANGVRVSCGLYEDYFSKLLIV